MKCENCGAALRPDLERGVFFCDYCGAELVPPPDADGVLVLAPSPPACAPSPQWHTQVSGTLDREQRPAVSGSSLQCPICAQPLSDGSLETYPLKYCTGCHGMLISMDRLVAMIEALRARLDRFSVRIAPRSPLDANRHLRCPSCGSVMDGHPYGGGGNVNVDSCEKCALLWLDRGELRRIAAAPDHDPLFGERLARRREGPDAES